jgi:hypothetical protein
MYKLQINNPTPERVLIPANEMEVGQLGRLSQSIVSRDHIVLRTHDVVISLTHPGVAWGLDAISAVKTLRVELLPKGTTITLTVE